MSDYSAPEQDRKAYLSQLTENQEYKVKANERAIRNLIDVDESLRLLVKLNSSEDSSDKDDGDTHKFQRKKVYASILSNWLEVHGKVRVYRARKTSSFMLIFSVFLALFVFLGFHMGYAYNTKVLPFMGYLPDVSMFMGEVFLAITLVISLSMNHLVTTKMKMLKFGWEYQESGNVSFTRGFGRYSVKGFLASLILLGISLYCIFFPGIKGTHCNIRHLSKRCFSFGILFFVAFALCLFSILASTIGNKAFSGGNNRHCKRYGIVVACLISSLLLFLLSFVLLPDGNGLLVESLIHNFWTNLNSMAV